MTEQASPLTRHDLEAKIVKRCWEDEDFRKEFTANPGGSFVRYLQVPATDLPSIFVHQEEPGSWHIVLPAKSANTAELSEEDMERVAGGSALNAFFKAHAKVTAATAAAASVLSAGGVVASVSAAVDKAAGW